MLYIPSRGAPLPVAGSTGWPSVNVSRLTSPADEIAAKAAQRRAEARIVSRLTKMDVTAPEKEVGNIPLIVLSP